MKKKPVRRHPQPPLGSRGVGLEEILSRARALEQEGKHEEALQLLDEAPPHLQRRAEFLIARGIILANLGCLQDAMLSLEEAQRRDPKNLLTYFLLGLLYIDLNMPAHARRSLQEVLEYRSAFPNDIVREAQSALENVEEDLSWLARGMGVSPREAEEAEYQFELGSRAMSADNFPLALRHFRRAAAIAPRWPAPWIAEVHVLLRDGQPQKAVEVAEPILSEHPVILPLRTMLIRAYLMLGQQEAAEATAQPFRTFPYEFPEELQQAAQALGYLNDDQGIYRLYQRYRDLAWEIDEPFSLLILGSAAANLGHFRTASRFWKQALAYGAIEHFVFTLQIAANRKAPGPGIADRYPTFQAIQLAPQRAVQQFQDLLLPWAKGESDQKPLRKQIGALIARYPIILRQIVQMFREDKARYIWIELLASLDHPEAREELRRFAFAQRGKLAERLYAVQQLALAGRGEVDPTRPVELWDENRQEWRQVAIPRWTVVKTEPAFFRSPAFQPIWNDVSALKEGRLTREQFTEKALSIAPEEPGVYALLGIIWLSHPVRSEEYLRKALELDPGHVGSRSALALLAIDREDLPTARQYLEPLADRREFTVVELLDYLLASAWMALRENDLALTRFYVDMAQRWDPEDIRFRRLELILVHEEPGSGIQTYRQRSRRIYERKRMRPILPDASLRECLERLSRESLAAMAIVYTVSYGSLRKEQLIQHLVETLTTPFDLEWAALALSETERQALRDVLDAGGLLPWDEFTARYGDDMDESPDWYYRRPQTPMGRLRLYGLLSDGTVEGQRVVLVPRELRILLPAALATITGQPDQSAIPEDDAI